MTKFATRAQVDVPALLASLGIDVAKRDGKSLFALCPAHDDHSPDTWSIVDNPRSARHGMHYCFSCQFGGGPFALIRRVKPELSLDETFDFLRVLPAHQPALEVDVVVAPYRPAIQSMRLPQEAVIGKRLEHWPSGARNYLLDRGVTERQIARYSIGYAVEGRLRGRIVLPMMDRSGVRSYTARDFTGQGQRYKEPQTREGAAQDAIFGEHAWEPDADVVVVVEGCFDHLAVDAVLQEFTGVDCAGLHGSRLWPSQAVKLSRYRQVVVMTDPDPAGDRVADEIATALGRYAAVVRARPPEGQDCGSLEPEALASLLERAFA